MTKHQILSTRNWIPRDAGIIARFSSVAFPQKIYEMTDYIVHFNRTLMHRTKTGQFKKKSKQIKMLRLFRTISSNPSANSQPFFSHNSSAASHT